MTKKRSIFEEVSDTEIKAGKTPSAALAGGIDRKPKGERRAIQIWMIVMFIMVAAMVVVGGLTRLSDAGLSITEWKPIHGAIPPLNAQEWAEEFAKYRETPQFMLAFPDMSLSEFKTIFWWEWGHRQLGRALGFVWAIGFIFFWAAGKIPAGWTGRLIVPGALGAVQGAIGWWMVSSGLVGEMTSVASYRLATHLGIAFLILGFLAWYVFLLGRSEADLMTARRASEVKLFKLSTGLLHFTLLQILLGALVAGIDAGRAAPTWPLMNGSFFPADAFYVPDGQGGSLAIWHAFFENPLLVQFIHRMAGYLLFIFGVVVWLRGRKSAYGKTRFAFNLVMLVMLAQVVLGIVTVLTSAHLHVAITHQIIAMVLFVLILRARYLSRYPIAGSIRKGTA